MPAHTRDFIDVTALLDAIILLTHQHAFGAYVTNEFEVYECGRKWCEMCMHTAKKPNISLPPEIVGLN